MNHPKLKCPSVYKELYSKTCLKRPPKIGFQELNAGEKYCRLLQRSILQFFQPSLSYHLSSRPLFCLFMSGHFRQILLYQSPLILTELFQHYLINVSYFTACYLYQVMMTLLFLNDVANDAESTQKSKITS